MNTLVALNSKTHQGLGIDKEKVESQAGNLHMVPVVLSEFLKLSLQYPIVITKNQDTGLFACVALFGLEKGENLFFKEGMWETLYLPLHVRRQPFFVAKSEGVDDRFIICIDMGHSSLKKENSDVEKVEKLFDLDGKETSYLTDVKNILAELFDGEKATKMFIDDLLSQNLLEPLQLQITLENKSSVRVDGLYTINEQTLNKLTSSQLFALHKRNYLHPIYTMITSIGHIYGLLERKNKRSQKL
jgi:hypothetical protein